MWHGVSVILLAFAVSMDSFVAGITYGMRKIRIPLLSTVIIAVCSGAVIFASMTAGRWLGGWFTGTNASMTGATILIGLGIWTLYQGLVHSRENEEKQVLPARLETPRVQVWTFEVKTIGLVIQILKTPMAADMDRSGSISATEAVLLGTALSLDAFGAGLGAAMIGLSPATVALAIAGMSALCLRLGMWVGFRSAKRSGAARALLYLPGILLILTGLLRFF
ncbi:sporulation membrane protein YtaF [Lihuaxuella thermophila]|uniref:Putative sporulation protein YtaF n=1 Tax=Lihuaxuella thermophila TaxID=1173111 RepID=A0A1H8CRU3_9BACL|nr:sporulation membrane protein YtaF [Lihuaxuella thermophila]SEM97592.1 putative sporulation protein YtaF [Lihuaxuella thermophila]